MPSVKLPQGISQRSLCTPVNFDPGRNENAMTSPTSRQAPLAAIAIRQVEKNTGASRNAFEQAAALQELGYRVVILAERGKAELAQRAGATFVKLPRWPFKGKFRRFWFNRRVQAWCKRHRPDLLVSHGDTVSNDVVYMHNCVHLASQRIHGKALPKDHEVAAIHDHVLMQGGFKRVAVNSQMMADDFMQRYAISADKIEVSYPGYDPQQFNPDMARRDRQTTRREFGADDETFLVGLITSGNFKKRNLDGFLEIAAHLNHLLPQRCRFLVVGKDDTTPYRKQAEALGIDSLIIWRGTEPNVERLYGALDVFVLPAHIEEFGRVALEAMACATPSVVSDWVGASELIRDLHPELVLDMDMQSWAERIAQLLESPERETLGQQLAELAKNYSHERQYEKLKVSFRSLTTD
ncbi:UDP-glucose:(heptosyl)LPS alpha-1,3-glucosyltransferase [Modicisalibacter xianhensis]|uniref:UDP-glucose:(Heptosyl)LPS alpha-1,3-glucosyltransferase n=2 Tax=Modicisalibacter xianhensis TaxID=442341 RepID=A0A1I3C7T9_9GAMM|nr:UDP-glucose:(heptosyl)LPS alpha-1,3-glucosyltransferase [Halomonas xianhensis]